MPSHPQPSRRGGPRPGAGAPRGNTNALKNGRYSQRGRALEELLEDLSGYACLIGSFAGPGQEELRRLAFALQCDALALLSELRGATGRPDQSNDPFRFIARRAGRNPASEVVW
jgi:hypothetical protein